ncbi:hypothetical protein A8F94_22225 [Bacillus sp. FJAT-27225]|uniref:GNAT family N-acetyltransferase n=1 Tax=Bacillus sp. FJAT-27225 TaxID=1743144 RepID=UPI00080C2DA4|nr:GNAT family N-acetyltransferase [Bacillus sp. FJAT-27225]OCA81588.1 hypothetical protein A8F94_22225 [Bacillus sp. FJAT-27225]
MLIRLLGEEDAADYKKLRLEALKKHPEAFASSYEEEVLYTEEFFASRLGGGEAQTIGAYEGEALIGSVTIFPETKQKLKHRANLVAMFVNPEYRKTGVGKALVHTAVGRARSLGATHVYLAVTSSNIPAKQLYLSAGFKVYGVDEQALKMDGVFYSEDLMVLKL